MRVQLEELLDAALILTQADMGNMQTLDEDDDLRIVVQRGFHRPFLEFFDRVTPNETGSSCGRAKSVRERVVVEDVTKSPIFLGTPSMKVMLTAGVRACQSTPLITHTEELVGVLSTHYPGKLYRLSERDLILLDGLAQQAADHMEHMRHVEELDGLNGGSGEFERALHVDGRYQPASYSPKQDEARTKILNQLDSGMKRTFPQLLVLSGVGRLVLTSTLEDLVSEGLVSRTSDGFVTLYSKQP
jgi:hypothetical protein